MTTGDAAREPAVPWWHRLRTRPRTTPSAWSRLRLSRRAMVGAGAGIMTTLTVALVLGLPIGRVIGAEDNGDGYRLYCGVGLLARTVDRFSLWKGGVVDFAVGPPSCTMWVPSSAGVVLRAAALVAPQGVLSVGAIAWWYAGLVGVVVMVAAWAASAGGSWRALVVAVPVVPMILPPFSRFFASTYAEPAGLLGVVAVGCGFAALTVTRPAARSARVTALVLVGAGGAMAATAKVAYLPVLLAAALVVVVVLVRDRLRPSWPVAAGITLVAAAVAVPIWGAAHYQGVIYEGANVHDMVFTLALPELGADGPAALGLPPDAAAVAGNGYFNGPPLPRSPWWQQQILERPRALRTDAVEALVTHPSALLSALGVGLQATTRADLPYLASGPADPSRFSSLAGDPGWSGARGPDFHAVLDTPGRAAWLPSVVVLLALAGALSTPMWRRRAPVIARWCLAAGSGAVTALVLVATALLGDGYFEVFKHVWLAAYVLLVTALCLVGALAALGVGLVARVRPPSRRADDGGHT